MNIKKLKELNVADKSDLFWSLGILKSLNMKNKFLSRSEDQLLDRQIKQIKECYYANFKSNI